MFVLSISTPLIVRLLYVSVTFHIDNIEHHQVKLKHRCDGTIRNHFDNLG